MNVYYRVRKQGWGGGGKARQVIKAGLNNLDEDAEMRVCGICSRPLAAAASGPDLRCLNIQGEPYSSIISSALGEIND